MPVGAKVHTRLKLRSDFRAELEIYRIERANYIQTPPMPYFDLRYVVGYLLPELTSPRAEKKYNHRTQRIRARAWTSKKSERRLTPC